MLAKMQEEAGISGKNAADGNKSKGKKCKAGDSIGDNAKMVIIEEDSDEE